VYLYCDMCCMYSDICQNIYKPHTPTIKCAIMYSSDVNKTQQNTCSEINQLHVFFIFGTTVRITLGQLFINIYTVMDYL